MKITSINLTAGGLAIMIDAPEAYAARDAAVRQFRDCLAAASAAAATTSPLCARLERLRQALAAEESALAAARAAEQAAISERQRLLAAGESPSSAIAAHAAAKSDAAARAEAITAIQDQIEDQELLLPQALADVANAAVLALADAQPPQPPSPEIPADLARVLIASVAGAKLAHLIGVHAADAHRQRVANEAELRRQQQRRQQRRREGRDKPAAPEKLPSWIDVEAQHVTGRQSAIPR